MEAIDRDSAKSWCDAHGYAIDKRGLPALEGAGADFSIPKDAGARVALVRGHMRAFEQEGEICIWLHDWNVWPSGQWEHLFQRFRLSYGISESLEARPCHLLRKKDFEAAVSIVTYSALMLWDCYVLGGSRRAFAFYSHDEVGKKSA